MSGVSGNNHRNKISRRKFLKSTGFGLAALGLGLTTGGSTAQAVMNSLKNRKRRTTSPTGMQTGGNGILLSSNFENRANIFNNPWKWSNASLSSNNPKSGNSCLKTELNKGSHYGVNARYDPVKAGDANGELREMWVHYWIRFSPQFEPGNAGGKLPGPSNVEPGGGKGGDVSTGHNGWSARGMFTPAGKYLDNAKNTGIDIGYYVYHMDMSGGFGDAIMAKTVPRDTWVNVVQHLKLNTVSNGSANRDGVLQMWVDDELLVDKQSMRFTEEPGRGINYYFDLYYGGSETSPKNQAVYFDNFKISSQPIQGKTGKSSNNRSNGDNSDVSNQCIV